MVYRRYFVTRLVSHLSTLISFVNKSPEDNFDIFRNFRRFNANIVLFGCGLIYSTWRWHLHCFSRGPSRRVNAKAQNPDPLFCPSLIGSRFRTSQWEFENRETFLSRIKTQKKISTDETTWKRRTVPSYTAMNSKKAFDEYVRGREVRPWDHSRFDFYSRFPEAHPRCHPATGTVRTWIRVCAPTPPAGLYNILHIDPVRSPMTRSHPLSSVQKAAPGETKASTINH